MQIKPSLRRIRCEGSALLMAMFVAIVTLPVIAVYIMCAQNQYNSVARSQHWNNALPVVEAGVEEAFAYLNRHCYSNGVNNGTIQWGGIDGWNVSQTTTKDTYTLPRRYIGSSYYDVVIEIDPAGPKTRPPCVTWRNATIRCVGYTPTTVAQGIGPAFGTVGYRANAAYVARQLRVETRLKTFYDKSLGANGDIKVNGQFLLDSFDSQMWSNSFFGIYDSRYNLSSNAVIASFGGNIDLGAQGRIYGGGDTSPGGTLENGAIGDEAWIEAGGTGIQSGAHAGDLNEPPMEDVVLPDVTWIPLMQCNCTVTYTNPAVEAAKVTSEIFPNPLPPDGLSGITTNTSGWVSQSLTLPSPLPNTVVTNTNSVTKLYYIDPTNVVNFIPDARPIASDPWIKTNVVTYVTQTNISTIQTAPPAYPSNAISGTIQTIPQQVTNFLTAPPPSNCLEPGSTWDYIYKTTGQGTQIDWESRQGTKYTNYTWLWLEKYVYQVAVTNSYTYWYRAYSYGTKTYTYTGVNIEETNVTSNFKYVVDSGNFKTLGDITLSGTDAMLIRGNATIYVTGDMKMSGNSQIIILRGASLKLYFAGDVSMSGQGIVNKNDSALNLSMFGLSTCTDISISGNAGFTGTLYAPNADIALKGGGNDSFDIVGSISGKNVTSSGHFQIHYDVNLWRSGPAQGYVAYGWMEERVGTR